MNCEICSLDSTVDSVMWTCAGCPRKFHAACVGVSVQRNSLRRKEKKIDPQSYVLPCCSSCQTIITLNFDIKLLTEQQKTIETQLNANTEVMHRLALQQEKPNLILEAIDGLECSLSFIKELRLNELVSSVNSNTASKVDNAVSTLSRGLEDSSLNKSDEVVGIKNHLTSLFNISMEATRNRIEEYVRDLTSDLSRELTAICDEVRNLSSLTLDMAAHCNAHEASNEKCLDDAASEEILNQIKSLASAVNIMDARLLPAASPPSLMEELINNEKAADSGWRILGTRKVWKADWTDYDTRKSRRLGQQKLADKARKRKKQYRAQNFDNKNNSYNQNRNNDDFICNNHASYNKCHYQNNSNNDNGHHQLPPDRELLAAAKHRFSRPPAGYQPTIQFQRGEILNPYPAMVECPPSTSAHPPNWTTLASSAHQSNWTTSASSCEPGACKHSCFQRN